MRRRALPESAYDFYTHDGRDGELGPTRDTFEEAKRDQKSIREKLAVWQRCTIEVCWELCEKKILRLISKKRSNRP